MAEDPHSRQVDLKCPECGSSGVATVISNGPGGIRTGTPPKRFHVRLAPNDVFEIACSRCKVAAFKAE
jgi:hypothetical protein